MLSSQCMPMLIRATVASEAQENMPEFAIGILINRRDDDAVIIDHVDELSLAAESGLTEGCEILAVNDHQIHSDAQCLELLRRFTKNGGKASVLASEGNRPNGYVYALARNAVHKRVFRGENMCIDGLELEEIEGQVKIVSVPDAGFFQGLRFKPGDIICAINGIPISSIRFARLALKVAKGALIPILTYRVSRRRSMRSVRLSVKIEDEYDIHGKLGEGSSSIVKKATHIASGKSYAIKIVDRKGLSKGEEAALKEEIAILNELDHDHICYLHDTFITSDHYNLVTELLEGGELIDRIAKKSSYDESEARDVCTILFDAIKYMHSRGVAHRDLKPENLMLQYKDSDSEIKLVDFGFAKHAPSDSSLSTLCGTPGYVAPEVLREEKYGTKCDMWSMGVIVYIMIGGYPPFYAAEPLEMMRLTMAGKFAFDPEYWGGISGGAKNMISALLVTNPRKRAGAYEIFSHPWMKEDANELSTRNLESSQTQLKKHIARQRFKGAVKSILFVNRFAGTNAIFSGKKKTSSLPQFLKDVSSDAQKRGSISSASQTSASSARSVRFA